MPLIANGSWVADSGATWTQTVRDQLDTLLGLSLDYDGTLDGDWTAAIGQIAATSDEGLQVGIDSLDPRTARGSALDRAVAPIVTRRPATQSRYTVDADQAGTIPAGAIFQEPNGVQWSAVATTVVVPGTDIVIEAVDGGPIALDSVSPTTLQAVTAIPGITTITHTPGSTFTIGRALESDSALLARWSLSLGQPNAPTGPGIRRSLLALEWMLAVSLERPNPGELRITIVPAPVGIDQETELGNAIYEAAGAGILTVGGSSITIEGADGYDVTVYWDVGVSQIVAVDVTLVLDSGVGLADVSQAVEDAIEAEFAALAVGETLYLLRVLGAIDTVAGVVGATVLLDGVAADKVPSASTNLLISGTYTIT